MKNRWRRVALAAACAALLWPAIRAQAQCTTTLADTTSTDCKAALKCQKGISSAAEKYVATVQTQLAAYINKSQSGAMLAPKYKCVGGPNFGKPCVATNGVCTSALHSAKGKLCSVDTDCGLTAAAGSCSYAVGTSCNTLAANSVGECQVDQTKNPYTKNIQAAQTALLKSVTTACITPNIPAATLGINNLADTCPAAGAAPTDAQAFQELVTCIENAAGGDFTTGNVVDTNMFAFQASTGTGGLPPNNKFNHAPHMLLELGGTQTLQLGTVVPSDNGTSVGGSITPLNLAHCVGGNANSSCVNDADCGTDSNAVAGVCTANPVVSGETALSGSPVFNPADPNSNGPTLSISARCSNNTSTCLVTHTKNAGNGTTTTGSVNLLTGHYSAQSPITTDVRVVSIAADCTIAQPCPVCEAATKTCGGPPADGPNTSAPCTAGDQQVTVECQPTTAVTATIPNPFTLSTDPKSMTAVGNGTQFCGFCDSSLAGGCQGVSHGTCTGGHCTGNSAICSSPAQCIDKTVCANGCQVDGDCAAITGATLCDLGSTANGFLGEATAAVINAPGSDNQYTPMVSGIFCTGITGNSTIDGSAGLPSPVRVVVPYAFSYVEPSN